MVAEIYHLIPGQEDAHLRFTQSCPVTPHPSDLRQKTTREQHRCHSARPLPRRPEERRTVTFDHQDRLESRRTIPLQTDDRVLTPLMPTTDSFHKPTTPERRPRVVKRHRSSSQSPASSSYGALQKSHSVSPPESIPLTPAFEWEEQSSYFGVRPEASGDDNGILADSHKPAPGLRSILVMIRRHNHTRGLIISPHTTLSQLRTQLVAKLKLSSNDFDLCSVIEHDDKLSLLDQGDWEAAVCHCRIKAGGRLEGQIELELREKNRGWVM